MTDHERAEHLIEGVHRIESLTLQLSSAVSEVIGDIEGLSKAAHREGGTRGVDRLGSALSTEGLYGLIRGRLHALGLERLLQRTNHTTESGWVEDRASRVRRVVT